MNWRLLTAINATIALVTIVAVVFDVTTRSHRARTRTTVQPSAEQNQAGEREAKARIEALDDLSQARVDDLGAVPAAELTQLMGRATPEQLAAMAFKFNDAPVDARTLGGLGVFFQAWTELDPKAALLGAFQLKDVTLRKLAATTVVNSVSPSAAPELIAHLTEHPDKDLLAECKNEFLDTLVSSWSYLDPESASKFVDSLGDTNTNLNYNAREKIGYAWGTLDPKAALDWVAKLGDNESGDRASLYNQVIRGWSLNNIAAAKDYVAQHLDDPGASYATASIAAAMFENDTEGAANWLNSLPPGDARDNAERRVASMWAQKNPSSAAHWLATLPEGEQTNVVSIIANNWVNTNWTDASRWLATLTGDVRDQAVTAAVNRDNSTPVESLSLALWIKSDQMRNDTIETVIRNWAATDAQAAETWVKGSPLSSEQQDRLHSVISETQQQATEATAERVIITH
jgi:hypothetical protein